MRIKSINIIFRIFLFIILSINAGCEQPETALIDIPAETDDNIDSHSFYTRYAPSKIDIMPLTEFISTGDAQQSKINLYVSLLDTFGSQIKSPGIFRFELYEQIPRSAVPKGKRVIIWPDIDLNDPVINNDYWRDFLRAYMFSLPYEQALSQDYILQVTCICPSGKRLSSDFILRHTK